MKRAWLVLFLIVLAVGGGMAWWFFRDTPEKVLRDGLGRLMDAQSMKSLVLDVAWTDPGTRVTTGFALAGQADTKDLTRPRVLGVLGLAEGVLGPEQTADVVLEQDRIALRPRSVSAEYRRLYENLVEDTEGTRFAVIGRDPFLNRYGYDGFIAHGQSADIRQNLPAILQTVRVTGPWVKAGLPGQRTITVPFRIDRPSFSPFLVSLMRTWNGDNPTPEELAWAERVSAGLGRGSFTLTINRDTREPKLLEGRWPQLDDDGKELARLHIRFEVDGLNKRVAIGIPEGFRDVTDRTVKPKIGTTLPSAAWRTLPEAARTSGTAFGASAGLNAAGSFETAPSRMINEDDVDLFHKYLEELKKKKSVY